jgi:hypothetical protein
MSDLGMAQDCARHARMFFNRPDLDLASAAPGTFALAPDNQMLTDLDGDYEAMAGMVFGPIPAFGEVMASIVELEQRLNQAQ